MSARPAPRAGTTARTSGETDTRWRIPSSPVRGARPVQVQALPAVAGVDDLPVAPRRYDVDAPPNDLREPTSVYDRNRRPTRSGRKVRRRTLEGRRRGGVARRVDRALFSSSLGDCIAGMGVNEDTFIAIAAGDRYGRGQHRRGRGAGWNVRVPDKRRRGARRGFGAGRPVVRARPEGACRRGRDARSGRRLATRSAWSTYCTVIPTTETVSRSTAYTALMVPTERRPYGFHLPNAPSVPATVAHVLGTQFLHLQECRRLPFESQHCLVRLPGNSAEGGRRRAVDSRQR